MIHKITFSIGNNGLENGFVEVENSRLFYQTHGQGERSNIIWFFIGGHVTLWLAAKFSELISPLVLINVSPCFMKHSDWHYGFDKQTLTEFTTQINNTDSVQELSDILFVPAMKEQANKLAQLKEWFEVMLSQAHYKSWLPYLFA